MAALPGLGLTIAVASALVGGAFGGVLGWTGALVYLLPLVPVGVVLLVIDWRTTLLPTRVIHPTYAALAVLVPAAALIDQDLGSLYRAGWGWLVVGGWFWVFWAVLRAWGFGDVRLARVLGPALGFLGWSQVLTGLALMVLLGGLGGAVLGLRDRSLRKRFPYRRPAAGRRSGRGHRGRHAAGRGRRPGRRGVRAVRIAVRRRAGRSVRR